MLLRLVSNKNLDQAELEQIQDILQKAPKHYSFKGAAIALFKKFSLVAHNSANYPAAARILENLLPEMEQKRIEKLKSIELGSQIGNDSSYSLHSGNPLAKKEEDHNLKTDYTGMLVTGIYGAYEQSTNSWQALQTSLEQSVNSDAAIHNFSLNTTANREIINQKP